jgi:hypothetical protein
MRLPLYLLLLLSSLALVFVPLPLPVVVAPCFHPPEQSLATGSVRAHHPVIVVAPAPAPHCPCPRCSPFPPHEQLLEVAVVGDVVVVVVILLVVSWTLRLSCGGGCWVVVPVCVDVPAPSCCCRCCRCSACVSTPQAVARGGGCGCDGRCSGGGTLSSCPHPHFVVVVCSRTPRPPCKQMLAAAVGCCCCPVLPSLLWFAAWSLSLSSLSPIVCQ